MHTNPNPALNPDLTAGDDLNQLLAGKRNRYYNARWFFRDPDAFESDCMNVAHRAQVLAWAYANMLKDQPENIFNLMELANIAIEAIDRDMDEMYKMAALVRDERLGQRNDLKCITDERDVAIEWLLRARGRPLAPDTIEELRGELEEESMRRRHAERFPDTAVAE